MATVIKDICLLWEKYWQPAWEQGLWARSSPRKAQISTLPSGGIQDQVGQSSEQPALVPDLEVVGGFHPMTGRLKLDDLQSPFQQKPFYDTMNPVAFQGFSESCISRGRQ